MSPVGTPGEVQAWLNYLNAGGSRAVLVHTAIQAADLTAVQGFDAVFLGWPPFPAGDAAFVAAIQKGLSLADAATLFASSQPYIQRANTTVA
jgi:D-serine deaminase-like pyridoxal phosphate-dependent protein